MDYGEQINRHTETNGSPSKGTRKAANALEHVFNPPIQQQSKLNPAYEGICLPNISTDGFVEASAMFTLNLETFKFKLKTQVHGLCKHNYSSLIALSRNDIQMKNLC